MNDDDDDLPSISIQFRFVSHKMKLKIRFNLFGDEIYMAHKKSTFSNSKCIKNPLLLYKNKEYVWIQRRNRCCQSH